MPIKREFIRNFCIIAHIDHGKSTLADRILEFTGALVKRKSKQQFLDNLEIERERGITIKAQTVTLDYIYKGQNYLLNLIDTPGHVDFTYEVSHSIKACEGALLVVDASQGVQAQTLANVYLAAENNLTILPVLNKIDLPASNPAAVLSEIQEFIGLDTTVHLKVSAKTGIGIEELLEAIIKNIPAPADNDTKPLKALIFDSWFDTYLGIVVLFRVMDGEIKQGDKIRIMSSSKDFVVNSLGKHTPFKTEVQRIASGEVGYLAASIKDLSDVRVGDTITNAARPATEPLAAYAEPKSMVFSGLYPIDNDDFDHLKDSIAKLALNDSSFSFEMESSAALGFGFRCGFLGLLHLEIITERLEKEYNLSIIITSPSVVYRIISTKGVELSVDNPSKMPSVQEIDEILEPYVHGTIILPDEYIGAVMKLAIERRGIHKGLEYIGPKRVCLKFELPLNEIVVNFYDELKSLTKGYASFDYELADYRPGDLVRLEILLNGDSIDALSMIVHRSNAYNKGRDLTQKLKELIPKQMYEVVIQAAIGSKIISRESISAMRKDVTAKCYGGDISRKRKLLEKQKEGKKRMKQFGTVEMPKEVFMEILRQKA